MLPLQAAQEYTGQQIHAVNLVTMWEEYLAFDTKHGGDGATIKKLLANTSDPTTRPGKKHSQVCVFQPHNVDNIRARWP